MELIASLLDPRKLLFLMLLAVLVLAIAFTGRMDPPRLVDPAEAVKQGCNVTAIVSDFTYQPGYAADGSLATVLVTRNGVDPNQAWLLLSHEPGYGELGTGLAWKSAVQNLSGKKGLATELLRAGDIYLMKQLGVRPLRQIWDTGNKGFKGYLGCVEVVLKASAALDGTPMWAVIPLP